MLYLEAPEKSRCEDVFFRFFQAEVVSGHGGGGIIVAFVSSTERMIFAVLWSLNVYRPEAVSSQVLCAVQM